MSSRILTSVSGAHIHISQGDLEDLFGSGSVLVPDPEAPSLVQPGFFVSKTRVTVSGPMVRRPLLLKVLGPCRSVTQVELLRSQLSQVGRKEVPIRSSGDLTGAAEVTLANNGNEIKRMAGIIAERHVHLPSRLLTVLGVEDGSYVQAKIHGERPAILEGVLVRKGDENTVPEIHLDTDEANALGIEGSGYYEIES